MDNELIRRFRGDEEKEEKSTFECNVYQYKQEVKHEFEHLVLDVFPLRIAELRKLLDNQQFNPKSDSVFDCEVNIPIPKSQTEVERSLKKFNCDQKNVFLFGNGSVHPNCHLLQMIHILKPLASRLIEEANRLKIGISLMIPKIEDGNNFGVGVQKTVQMSVTTTQANTQKQLDSISDYLRKRAELVTKIGRFPNCIDYRRAVHQLDNKFRLFLSFFAINLYHQYMHLHDLFTKNLNKIKNPRNSHNIML